jgi:hypothetical protein
VLAAPPITRLPHVCPAPLNVLAVFVVLEETTVDDAALSVKLVASISIILAVPDTVKVLDPRVIVLVLVVSEIKSLVVIANPAESKVPARTSISRPVVPVLRISARVKEPPGTSIKTSQVIVCPLESSVNAAPEDVYKRRFAPVPAQVTPVPRVRLPLTCISEFVILNVIAFVRVDISNVPNIKSKLQA